MNESLPGQHPAVWSIMRVPPAQGEALTALSPPKPLLATGTTLVPCAFGRRQLP